MEIFLASFVDDVLFTPDSKPADVYAVFDKSTIKTKSQLTDIFNKAKSQKITKPISKVEDIVPSSLAGGRKVQPPTAQELRGSLLKGSNTLKESQGLQKQARDVLEVEKSSENIKIRVFFP